MPYNGSVLQIRLPDDLRGRFPEFFQRTVVRVTTDRRLAQRLQNVVLLDFENRFFQYLINEAKNQHFDGIYASVRSPIDSEGTLSAFRLRWQNDQGDALTEEFVTVFRNAQGEFKFNPPFLTAWLLIDPKTSPVLDEDHQQRPNIFDSLLGEADRRLANSSTRFKHPNSLVTLAAADFRHDRGND